LHKRLPYDPYATNQAAPPSQYLRRQIRRSGPGIDTYHLPDGGEVTLLSGPNGEPELDAEAPTITQLRSAADDIMRLGRGTGYTAVNEGEHWDAYDGNGVSITVEFRNAMAMNNVVLSTYVYLAIQHQIANGYHDGTPTLTDIETENFFIEIQGQLAPPPPRQPPVTVPVRNGTSLFQYPWGQLDALQWWAMNGPGCQKYQWPYPRGEAASPREEPRRVAGKRCVRKCKDCKTGDHSKPSIPQGTGDFTFSVPRRDNESVWIDPASGWQAVQVSHAAHLLGYNVSQDHDYLAFKPSEFVTKWATRVDSGSFATNEEVDTAFAGMIFGSELPNVDEQGFARSVLLGEVGSWLRKSRCDASANCSDRAGAI
jgi:hypothetical protein